MDILAGLGHGFAVVLQPVNLLHCFVGVFIGTLVGVLPGIGPVSAMALLLPVTLSGTPEAGIIMMAGVYYGAMYGGSTTSILVNIPGEAASVVTCLDGHQMAKQGRAGPALGISALSSFAAGTFAVIALMLLAPALADVAIVFGPAEYFSLMVLGLTLLTFLSQGSMVKALVMVLFGVLGYLMRKFSYEPAPLVLAFVLGPMLENNLRKSLILSQGDFTVFIERPISAVCLVLALARRRARLATIQS